MSFPKTFIESLWCPWRVEYFEAEYKSGNDFFLDAARATNDADHLVVGRDSHAFLIMNKYPYAVGHLMAVPNRKVADLEDLTKDEFVSLWELTKCAQRILRSEVRAHGFNIGFNIGRAGGAGKEDHLHLHIVPRWENDSNFITVISQTRILPQALEPLYKKLTTAYREMVAPVMPQRTHP